MASALTSLLNASGSPVTATSSGDVITLPTRKITLWTAVWSEAQNHLTLPGLGRWFFGGTIADEAFFILISQNENLGRVLAVLRRCPSTLRGVLETRNGLINRLAWHAWLLFRA
jgi:hypothetical protein